MMLLLLLLISVAVAMPQGDFSSFLSSHHLSYSGPELKLRLGLFQRHSKEIAAHNALPNKNWEAAVNDFALLTDAERKQFLGLGNVSDILTAAEVKPFLSSGLRAAPASIDHTTLGHVTAVKNQGGCGSCWAFGAVASFEGSYAITTQKLKVFAEQELLDCTYSDTRDGCNGGWYQQAWSYVERSGRLGLASEIPYRARDGACNHAAKTNGANNVKYTGYARVSGDDQLKAAAAEYVPAVAITVENDFFSYSSGWFDGCNTPASVNHAVAVVGYTDGYWKVRNSWGSGWGEGGYIRMAREKSSICKIANYVMYPTLTKVALPWIKITSSTGTVNKPASATALKLKVKCQADGIYERIKVFTYNNGQTGHIELITHGLNDSRYSLFCMGAGRRNWYGGERYGGSQFSNAQRGACDAQGFREYEYKQFSDRYEVRVGSFVDTFSSRSRGRCNVWYNAVNFEIAHAPEAFYQWVA